MSKNTAPERRHPEEFIAVSGEGRKEGKGETYCGLLVLLLVATKERRETAYVDDRPFWGVSTQGTGILPPPPSVKC